MFAGQESWVRLIYLETSFAHVVQNNKYVDIP